MSAKLLKNKRKNIPEKIKVVLTKAKASPTAIQALDSEIKQAQHDKTRIQKIMEDNNLPSY